MDDQAVCFPTHIYLFIFCSGSNYSLKRTENIFVNYHIANHCNHSMCHSNVSPKATCRLICIDFFCSLLLSCFNLQTHFGRMCYNQLKPKLNFFFFSKICFYKLQ